MGTHAKPRTRVRTAALGTLAVGATLTGVGLTAAALDPAGTSLADGTLSADPVNLAASGLGAPVPVADAGALDGGSPGVNALSAGTVPTLGAGGVAQGLLPGSAKASGPRHAKPEPTWPRGGTIGGVPEHESPQGGVTNAPASTGGGAGSGGAGSAAGRPTGTGGGSTGTASGMLPIGPVSMSSIAQTLNQIAPGMPGHLSGSLSTAKSAVGSLLGELAGLL